MKWLAWIAVVIAVPFVLCIADFYIGRYIARKRTDWPNYPFRNGKIKLLVRGEDMFSHYFADLLKAQSSIHILFYIVKNDFFGHLFFDILMNQAQKGVKVRLLLDWIGSRTVSKKMIKKARRKGIEIHYCNKPRFPFFFFTTQRRNHRKITVIDGKIGYVGGYNIGKEYIDLDKVLSPWRDYHLRVEGTGTADLQHVFLLDWKRSTGEKHFNEPSLFPPLPEGSVTHRFFPTEGVGAEEEIIRHIEKASNSIFIGTPYFIPPKKVISALEKALENNIKVTILVPNISDHPIVKEASFPYLRRILAQGGTVYQYKKGFFHAKVLLFDDAVCDIGTANFDYRSLLLNDEVNCFIYDKTFIACVKKVIHEDILQSNQLSYQDLQSVNIGFRAKECIGALMKGLL